MRCLSLTQPYASLIARGEKTIETRSWRTAYREPLAIHAAQAFPPAARRRCLADPFFPALGGAALLDRRRILDGMPRGAIVAICRLVSCIRTDEVRDAAHAGRLCGVPVGAHEQAFGDYGPDRWAWVLTAAVALPEPISARGRLGLWQWTPPPGFVAPAPRSAMANRLEEQ